MNIGVISRSFSCNIADYGVKQTQETDKFYYQFDLMIHKYEDKIFLTGSAHKSEKRSLINE